MKTQEELDKVVATADRYFADIEYRVVASAKSHWMDFKAYKAMVVDGQPVYEREGSVCPMSDASPDLAGAQVFLSGHVKWDGCSNVVFDEQEQAALHFCGKEMATNVGVLLGRIYDLAAELIPAWDRA